MKNFDLNNFMFGFFAIALISIGILITYIGINSNQGTTQVPTQIIDTVYYVVPIDTTVVINDKPWPIKIVRVEKNTNDFINGSWIVTTENGLTFYTNEKKYVGQIAFYMDNNGDIIKNYGENKLDPRQWK